MACSVYKVFTRERGTYQDVNGIQEYFRDYINNNLQLIIDCVSTNTALKVVKRDASGNFAAGTITANLTGDVTGSLTGNVIGDLTGNVTGNVTGSLSGNVTGNCSGSSGSCTGNAATATTATTATNATNATTAANATNATNADKLDGKHWVTVISGAINVTTTPIYINLRLGGSIKFYRLSAYSDASTYWVNIGNDAVDGVNATIHQKTSGLYDVLRLVTTLGSTNVTYRVEIWE